VIPQHTQGFGELAQRGEERPFPRRAPAGPLPKRQPQHLKRIEARQRQGGGVNQTRQHDQTGQDRAPDKGAPGFGHPVALGPRAVQMRALGKGVARAQAALMQGSEIRESHREGDARVQDPYCIRCQAQVSGAAIDLLRRAGEVLEIEANAVTDNPLVLVAEGRIVSGGNFHAEPVGFAADQIAVAVAEIGAIAQRRVALMVDPTLSFDLPPFLTPDPGLNSGLMIAEVTTAALMSENKHLANPCTTDSTPTSANQEDHVSMAAHAARRLGRMNANLNVILGVEAICAAQGIGFRAPLTTSAPLSRGVARLREEVPALGEDRWLAPDLAAAAKLVREGALVRAAGLEMGL